MKTNPLRKLEAPPPQMAERIMRDVRGWRQPPAGPASWLIGAQAALLAVLMFVGAGTLPQRWDETVVVVQDLSAALVAATVDFSDKVGGLLLPEIKGGIL